MKRHKMIMRLCAYAMLGDGKIGDPEKEIILDAIATEGLLENSEETAESVYDKIYSTLSSDNNLENEALSKSLFTSLGRSTESERNLKKELVYYVRIARSDQKLLDVEREGFRLICKLHKLENPTLLWNELHREAENLEKEKKLLSHLKLRSGMIERKPNLSLEDFQAIQQIISFYQIEGALKKSASYVLEKERTKENVKLNSRNKLITKYSFILFCSLAFILFLRIPACELATDYSAPDLALPQNETFSGILTDSVHSILIDKISYSLRNQQFAYELDTILQEEFACYAGNMVTLRDVITNKINDDVLLVLSHTDMAAFRFLCGGIGLIIFPIWTIIMVIIFCVKRKSENANPKYIKKNLKFLLRWILGLTVVGTIFCYDIGILFMMLAIEWLIFMRESKDEEQNKTNMLVVMVAVAIITDISYGLVNTTLLHHGEIELLTIAAPVFLGCVCFLFGKWLEDNRENDKLESKQMNEIVASISGNIIQQ